MLLQDQNGVDPETCSTWQNAFRFLQRTLRQCVPKVLDHFIPPTTTSLKMFYHISAVQTRDTDTQTYTQVTVVNLFYCIP